MSKDCRAHEHLQPNVDLLGTRETIVLSGLACTKVLHGESGSQGQHRSWRLPGMPHQSFRTPTLFAGFSVWGNQWNKMMYFYHHWYRELHILISIYDVYRAAKCLRAPMMNNGFRDYVQDYVRNVRGYVRLQARQSDSPYGAYAQFPPGPIPAFRGALMIDSGGFSFGDPKKLARTREIYRGVLSRNPEDTFAASVVDFAETMLKVVDAEESHWDQQAVTSLAIRAQGINLSHQLAVRGDFVATLDRVIDNYDYPLERKRRRAFFSLECAKAALAEKARLEGHFSSALLAVIHPVGPGPSELKDLGFDRAYCLYRRELDYYVSELVMAEERFNVQFDGFGIGSLVPLQDYEMIRLVTTALRDSLAAHNMEDRFLHAFGATNKKASYLFEFGFDSFDTTYHMVRAKNRYLYDRESDSYVSSRTLEKWNCDCPICSSYSLDRLRENRKGVKEVATVLHGLHNLYTNHLEKIRGLGL